MKDGTSVRIGIIGTGSIARDQHGPACVEVAGAQLNSVLSRTAENADNFASSFVLDRKVKSFIDRDAFLADDSLDAVIIASPDSLHFEQAKACLEAGKHVLVEKPFALTLDESLALIQLADKTGLQLGVGFHLRWHPGIEHVLNLIKKREIGNVRHIAMRWTFLRDTTADWRADPAFSRWWSLSGVGSHCLDLMRMFMDRFGWTRSFLSGSCMSGILGSRNEETTLITAIFQQGLTAQILSSVLFPSQSELSFFGDKGSITCDGLLGRSAPGIVTLNGMPSTYVFENPYRRQLEGFCSSIIKGSPFPVHGKVWIDVLNDLNHISREE
ncbi:Gfo/Idh/MocA family protein [Nonomuraea sp. NPDC003560]|uniref:Gfo/Idh/MocA family protein n=1 Tax=Nonomuraea sp. NPDC003560 TaxID=3364341 RepID=UPI0036D163CD